MLGSLRQGGLVVLVTVDMPLRFSDQGEGAGARVGSIVVGNQLLPKGGI